MSATGCRSKGVTLIELLVGLVIVAVVLGAVRLAFPDSGSRRTELAAERAEALLQLACERAELTGRDIGVGFSRQQVAFGPMQGPAWQPIADSPIEALRPRTLDALVTLALRVDQRPLLLGITLPEQPQVACLTSGEWLPFELDVMGPEGARWTLRGDVDGSIIRERADDRRP